MNDEQRHKLDMLLRSLPVEPAAKLVRALEYELLRGGTDLPCKLILDTLRPILRDAGRPIGRVLSPSRHFCLPFEDLLVQSHSEPRMPGRVARSSILPIWNWLLREVMPDTLRDMCARITEHTLNADGPSLSAAVAVLHGASSTALISVLDRAPPGSEEETELIETLGSANIVADAREIALLLSAAPEIMEVRWDLPKGTPKFDNRMIHSVRDAYEAAHAKSPDAAFYVPLIAMVRLQKPWEIMRLGRHLTRSNKDTLLSRTDLSILGEYLFREIQIAIRVLHEPVVGTEGFVRLGDAASRIAGITNGLTRELEILRDGDWGRRLIEVRTEAADLVSRHLDRMRPEIARVLPTRSIGAYAGRPAHHPDLTNWPDQQRAEQLSARLGFLRESKSYADGLGITRECADMVAAVSQALSRYGDDLLDILRSAYGERQAIAGAYLEVIADAATALKGEGAGEKVRRAGRAASARDIA